MSRRLASYLVTGALLVSVAVGSIGAAQGLGKDLMGDLGTHVLSAVISDIGDPPPEDPAPPGLTSTAVNWEARPMEAISLNFS